MPCSLQPSVFCSRPNCPAQYWDDPADGIKQDEGTLLPLWSFTNPRAKSRAVTAIAWSPRYFDMFAVGYGSFDFLKPTTGGCRGGAVCAGLPGWVPY